MTHLQPYDRSDSSDAAPAVTFQPLEEQSSVTAVAAASLCHGRFHINRVSAAS